MTVLARCRATSIATRNESRQAWLEFQHVNDVPIDGSFTELVCLDTTPGDREVVRYTLTAPVWEPQ